ncbi:MAG: thiolase family protein [Patescibacteria group bacterium]
MSQHKGDPVIVSAVRTAFGKGIRGTLKDTRPDEMLAVVMSELLRRVPNLQPQELGDIVIGCGFPEGPQGMNVARLAALRAGIPETVPALTINRFCASGLDSLAQCTSRIREGEIEAALAGGVESMSMVPMTGTQPRLNPHLVKSHPEAYFSMGLTAERVVERFDISREDQDRFALQSNQRAVAAIKAGKLKEEIVPLKVSVTEPTQDGKIKTSEFEFKIDEGPRADTSLAALAKLKPAFKKNGTVTAGNSSKLADGAAALVVMSARKAKQLGLRPLGRLLGYAVAGVPPEIMGVGPAIAIPKLLKRFNLKVADIDLFEINEAFAAQILYVLRKLKIPEDKINVNGGAIALGHPLGVTGTRLAGTLLYEMQRRKSRYGVVSMCVGGGMGAAGLFERPL